jgi:uncharacterized protein
LQPIPRKALILSLLAATVLAGVSAAGWIAARNYHALHSELEADPPSALLNTPERTGIEGLTSVSFVSTDGLTLSGWYKPPGNGAAIVVTHGTNSDRSTMLPELRLLTAGGFGVLAFDWPGLGHSQGTVRWDGQARHALTAAVDWLGSQPGVDPGRIGGLGFSIGGFVMTQVAAGDPRLRAVVLEAPPPDYDDYIRVHNSRWGVLSEWPARWAVRDSGLLDSAVEPLKLIDRIAPRPVLLLAGSVDPTIPPALVTKLYAAAHAPKSLWIVEQARHGGYASVAAVQYSQRITDFFAQGLAQGSSETGFPSQPVAKQ